MHTIEKKVSNQYNLHSYLKGLEKEQSKPNQVKEANNKDKREINEIKSIKTVEKINETKTVFLKRQINLANLYQD